MSNCLPCGCGAIVIFVVLAVVLLAVTGNITCEVGRDKDPDIASFPRPIRFQIHFNRALERLSTGRWEEAIDESTAAIAIDSGNAEVYSNRGTAYIGLDQFERAIEDFNTALSLNPEAAIAYNNRGFAYYSLGQYQRAIGDYDEAIRIDPQDANSYGNRAVAYTLLGKDKEAQQDVNRAVELGFDRGMLDGKIEELRKQR